MTNTTVALADTLDIDALLQPIPGDNPAGDERAYARGLRDQLTELRREEREEDFDEDMRPADLKHADWQGVIQAAGEALETTTKDLRIACHLIEAATNLQGFAGLHDGLRLLRQLIEQCWDRIYPSLDDGDLECRAAPMANMLDDPGHGNCFPLTVQMIPLIGTSRTNYGLIQWQRAKQTGDAKVQEELAVAVLETPIAALEATVEAIHGCEEELDRLIPLLDDKLGSSAPSMTHLRDAISQCGQLVREGFLQSADTAEKTRPSCPSNPAESEPVARGAGTGTDQAMVTRNEAYTQLKRAAETLQKLEPHSPIPYLVKRAVQLGRLPFPQLIEKLIRDGSVLEELGREFGLAGVTADQSALTD